MSLQLPPWLRESRDCSELLGFLSVQEMGAVLEAAYIGYEVTICTGIEWLKAPPWDNFPREVVRTCARKLRSGVKWVAICQTPNGLPEYVRRMWILPLTNVPIETWLEVVKAERNAWDDWKA